MGQVNLVIGRGMYDGDPNVDWFSGRIKGVEVFAQALTAAEVGGLP